MTQEEKNIFIQPKRRSVRQRSGFNVGGGKTGSECLIDQTDKYQILGKELKINFEDTDVLFSKLFLENTYFYASGLYLYSNEDMIISGSICINSQKNGANSIVENHTQSIIKNTWNRIGFHVEDNTILENVKYKVNVNFIILSKKENSKVEIFGFQSGPVIYYKDRGSYKKNFEEKTELYKPEIYYLPFRSLSISNAKNCGKGVIVRKSCNRCARFLPIDIKNELNPLGFSNHCKKRAPCKHNAFGRYIIENPENVNLLPQDLQGQVKTFLGKKYFTTHFGYQLECRTCKKFEVNAPLNPLRNKAQHHEDGSRRRAFERMIIELTNMDVVKNYRTTHKKEFQDSIWEKFNKKCFACGKSLQKVSNMDIDHTLPLAYLWPLDETATCLCKTCNSSKHDLFPAEFSLYSKEKIKQLSTITGIPLLILASEKRIVNKKIAILLVKNVSWLFDNFLARRDYQKIKKGKRISDLIYKALQKVLVPENIDLLELYFKKENKYPRTITLN